MVCRQFSTLAPRIPCEHACVGLTRCLRKVTIESSQLRRRYPGSQWIDPALDRMLAVRCA